MVLPLASVSVPRNAPVDGSKALIIAVVVGEVADEQVAGERAEAGRGQGDAPRRGELAAGDQLAEESPAGRECRHGPLPWVGPGLVGMPGRRVGHEEIAVDVLHVERDEPGRGAGGRRTRWGRSLCGLNEPSKTSIRFCASLAA